MRWRRWALLVTCALGAVALWPRQAAAAQPDGPAVIGRLRDSQGSPVAGADVTLLTVESETVLAQTETQEDGSFALIVDGDFAAESTPIALRVARAHFATLDQPLSGVEMGRLQTGQSLRLPTQTMQRDLGLAFWLAAAVFVGMLAAIALSQLHSTLIALSGAVLLLMISYLSTAFTQALFVFTFERALTYVDWEVIFLVMGMMMFIAVIERTGVLQWLAFSAYRLSGGRASLLLLILMGVAGVASAFLDNVTTMLLMTPITVQIALTLQINPLSLLIPEVMASNVVGVSTLVGTPTNILIGSFADISFNDFLVNLTPGVLLAFTGLILYCLFIYRRELRQAEELSPAIIEQLARRSQITEPQNLRKGAWIGAAMLFLFIFGERVHLVPAVTALFGSTALLLWTRPDIEAVVDAVDWTTLVFFMALFMVIGAVQEVGLIGVAADLIGRLVGESLLLAMLAIIWVGALLSAVVANIPFTAAMLPVVSFLTGSIPAAESNALYYCLSVGSAMGGNGSLIGASANLVTAGIAEQAGYPISYGHFLRKGIPAVVITLALATVWLLLRFL